MVTLDIWWLGLLAFFCGMLGAGIVAAVMVVTTRKSTAEKIKDALDRTTLAEAEEQERTVRYAHALRRGEQSMHPAARVAARVTGFVLECAVCILILLWVIGPSIKVDGKPLSAAQAVVGGIIWATAYRLGSALLWWVVSKFKSGAPQ